MLPGEHATDPAAAADAGATVQARDHLRMARPTLSAATGLSRGQAIAAATVLSGLVLFSVVTPNALAATLITLCGGAFVCLIGVRAAAAFGLGRSPAGAKFVEPDVTTLPRYGVLVPLHHEAEAVPQLVAALDRLRYPRALLHGQLLIEADDQATLEAVKGLRLPDWLEVTLIAPMAPRTKPKALNVGLARTDARLLGVFDAEDRPDPDQLLRAAAAFAGGPQDLACVQAALDVTRWRRDDAWLGLQFALEYAIHFRLLLPAWSALGWPIPLGGTSNHFRVQALRACGGWDPYNVTEDADLGVRLARDGWRIGLLDSATQEEAAPGLSAWLGQRSRWIKGHLQTWLVHMRDTPALARDIGLWPALGLQITLLGSLASAFLHLPLIGLAGITLVRGELDPGPATLLSAGYLSVLACAGVIIAQGRLAASPLQATMALISLPFYWPLQSIAAARAAWELWRDPHRWVKTPRCAPGDDDGDERRRTDHTRRAGRFGGAGDFRPVAWRTARRSDAAAAHSMDAGGADRDLRSGAGAGAPSESGGA